MNKHNTPSASSTSDHQEASRRASNETLQHVPFTQPFTSSSTPRQFASAGPLGLCSFALTTFMLSCINMHARGQTKPHAVVGLAFAYGGLVQLLAGMWEMASNNIFGATAFSSYGAFWISYAILLTPGFHITTSDPSNPYGTPEPHAVIGFFLAGWFIFTTVLLLLTLRSSLAFFMLFFFVDLTLLCLTCQSFALDDGSMGVAEGLQMAGGLFGFLAAFLAWYNALAGMADSSNSFFHVPLIDFPWSDNGQRIRMQNKSRDLA